MSQIDDVICTYAYVIIDNNTWRILCDMIEINWSNCYGIII